MDTEKKESSVFHQLTRYSRGLALKRRLQALPDASEIINGPSRWDFLIRALAQGEEVKITLVSSAALHASIPCSLLVSGVDYCNDDQWMFRGCVIGPGSHSEHSGHVDGYIDLHARTGNVIYLTGRRSELGKLESELFRLAARNWSETVTPEKEAEVEGLRQAIAVKKDALGLNELRGR